MLSRLCNIPKQKSFFLFGPRQTGKTTLIRELFSGKRLWTLDLLAPGVSERYLADPAMFGRELLAKLKETPSLEVVFIDEVQRVPKLLDLVQNLLAEKKLQFILSGSSARKLRRGGANLLGGRAVERRLFPLTYSELGKEFDLQSVLRYGTIPGIVLGHSSDDKFDLLNAYVSTYLREEIQQEAIVRNVAGFISFLEVAAQQSGQILNFTGVGRDATLHARTVQTYYQILEDTLIGIRLPAYRRSVRRRLRVGAKFYLFDIGVLNSLERQLRSEPDVVRYGKLFEHFIVLDTYRLAKYLSGDAEIYYWRTRDDLEVDLVIEHKGKLIAAIEIKSSQRVTSEYLSGLRAFASEHPKVPCFVVARVPEPFELEGVTVLPWERYLLEIAAMLKD